MNIRIASATTVLLFAACSGGAPPTAAPSAAPAATLTLAPSATRAAATAAATPTTAPTVPPISPTPTAPPTSTGAVDLEALIPTQVGGITLTPESVAINDFLREYETFQALLVAVGRSPADASIVQAQGSDQQTGEVAIIQAFRVAGADAAALMNGVVEFWRGFEADGVVATPTTIAGKELIVLGNPTTEAQYKSYFYSYGDIVFRLGYNGDNFDEKMAELVSQLP